jgi:hypothetical protein
LAPGRPFSRLAVGQCPKDLSTLSSSRTKPALRLVERWFGELTDRKIKRGAHRSVKELNADIRDWLEHWNENPKPYVWTKTADQILETLAAYCQRITGSGH